MLADSPGTIALPTSEIGRFTLNTVCLVGTQQPDGTHLATMSSASVTENLNAVVRGLRDIDEWVWVLGDDHIWPGDCLMRLLATMDEHPDIDVLVPLVTKRNPPWHLVVFREAGVYEEDNLPRWQPIPWEDIPANGVFQVDAAGSAGMLIRRHVLDTLGDPWFRSTGGVVLNEDVTFCADVRAHGYTVYATADTVMGHLGIFNVRPLYRGGRWGALTEFSSPQEQFRQLFMPDIEEPHAAVANGR